MEFIEGKDKIGIYLAPHLKQYLFDELSYDYLNKSKNFDILKDVPVPIKKTELSSLTTLSIAKNMAFVIGCDPTFVHKDSYIQYIRRNFKENFVNALINEGVDSAAARDFDFACIMFRAALLLEPESVDALYCYGRACKDSYELSESEDYVARYKAESIEAFEVLTLKNEDFAMGYYFLGYGYLNLGLYIKAKLTFDTFLKLSDDNELKEEVSARVALLDDPIKIEKGYNMILSGKFNEGIKILEEYKTGSFENWWPLWYYLGEAYTNTGRDKEAIESYQKVLLYSPSNIDTMKKLVILYENDNNTLKADKYKNKIKVIEENIEKDKELKNNVS